MRVAISFVLAVAIVTIGVMQSQLVIPVNLKKQSCQTELKMEKMGFPKHLSSSILLASQITNISPEFLIALMQTESSFDKKAVSSKGYKGLMQIPYTVFDEDINTLIGAKIFKEKLTLTNGNVVDAIILYKGYANDRVRGRMQAEKVLLLYSKLSEMEV